MAGSFRWLSHNTGSCLAVSRNWTPNRRVHWWACGRAHCSRDRKRSLSRLPRGNIRRDHLCNTGNHRLCGGRGIDKRNPRRIFWLLRWSGRRNYSDHTCYLRSDRINNRRTHRWTANKIENPPFYLLRRARLFTNYSCWNSTIKMISNGDQGKDGHQDRDNFRRAKRSHDRGPGTCQTRFPTTFGCRTS